MDTEAAKKVHEMEQELHDIYTKYNTYGLSIYYMDGDLRIRSFNIAPFDGAIQLLDQVLKTYNKNTSNYVNLKHNNITQK